MTDWIARFRDGPAAGSLERAFAGQPVWKRLELAPIHDSWRIVGLGAGVCDPPWPGQVTYCLAEVLDGDVFPVAYYDVDS